MKVEKIDRVGINVKDFDKARKLFADLLGPEFDEPTEVKEMDMKTTHHTLGLELAGPINPDGPFAKSIEKKGEGFSFIAFKVSNLEEAVAEMQSHGIRIAGRLASGGVRLANCNPKDTFGVSIQLAEYK